MFPEKIFSIVLYCMTILFTLASCEKYTIEEKAPDMQFPVGRSFLGASELDVWVDAQKIEPEMLDDSCGGYWLDFHGDLLPGHGVLKFRFTRTRETLQLYHDPYPEDQKWLASSEFIDSDQDVLISQARELTTDLETRIEKAKSIQQFVIGHVRFQVYNNSFLDKASKTYEVKYGTCMNFSRLFIALCRAAEIPSRSVWGVVYGYDDDQLYNYHHQWAEILDESGYWHPLDFGYSRDFDLNDIRYLDLIYGAEENTLIGSKKLDNIVLDDLIYINNYPVTLSGKLDFVLIDDHRPISMTIEYQYSY